MSVADEIDRLALALELAEAPRKSARGNADV